MHDLPPSFTVLFCTFHSRSFFENREFVHILCSHLFFSAPSFGPFGPPRSIPPGKKPKQVHCPFFLLGRTAQARVVCKNPTTGVQILFTQQSVISCCHERPRMPPFCLFHFANDRVSLFRNNQQKGTFTFSSKTKILSGNPRRPGVKCSLCVASARY